MNKRCKIGSGGTDGSSERRRCRLIRRSFPAAFFCLLLPLLAGCPAEPAEHRPPALKIVCCDEMTFRQTYRDYFNAYFPDWEITHVPYFTFAEEAPGLRVSKPLDIRELTEREKPDLLVIPSYAYEELAKAGLLLDLNELAARDRFDWSAIEPGVRERLRTDDSGRLYGISPYFTADALYYNEDLFRAFGVEPPSAPLTWRETLELAGRFAEDGRRVTDIYGLHIQWVDRPYLLAERIAATEGLSPLDPDKNSLRVTSESWRQLFDTLIEAYRVGAVGMTRVAGREVDGVSYYGPEEIAQADLFAKGQAALTVGGSELMHELKANPPGFAWGVLPGPVHSLMPDAVGSYMTGDVFAIPAASGRPEAAWRVIRFFLSDRAGQISAALGGFSANRYYVFANPKYPQWKQDPDYAVFYGRLPAPAPARPSYDFLAAFGERFDREVHAVLAGEKSPEEALQTLERDAGPLLERERARPSAEPSS